jgi:hypothetical protein
MKPTTSKIVRVWLLTLEKYLINILGDEVIFTYCNRNGYLVTFKLKAEFNDDICNRFVMGR